MKKIILCLLTLSITFMLTGCFEKKVPDHWYDATIDYYREGFKTGWKNEKPDLYILDELKEKDKKFGYLLRDLDGDGAPEVLIGIIDDSNETKFTDVIIWHKDFGAHRSLNTGDGYYIYLCDDNVLRMDSWYGSETNISYMIYNSENNSFLNVDGGSKPQKVELTEF